MKDRCLLFLLLQSFSSLVVDYKCRTGERKCSDGLKCVSDYSICNGYADCEDKSDEDVEMCKGKLYRCYQGAITAFGAKNKSLVVS